MKSVNGYRWGMVRLVPVAVAVWAGCCAVYGGVAGEFLAMPASVRSAALGGCGLVSEGDAFSLFRNPAAVALVRHPAVGAGFSRYVYDVSGGSLSGAYPAGRFTMAAGWLQVDSERQEVWDLSGHMVGDNLRFNASVVPLVAGVRLGRWLLGAGVSRYRETVMDWELLVVGGGFGVMYRSDWFTLGGSVVNIGRNIDDDLPLGVQGGGMIHFGDSAVVFEVGGTPEEEDLIVRVGGEVGLWRTVYLRVGYASGDHRGFTSGVGVRVGGIGVDYAIAAAGGFEPLHHVGIAYAFGGGGREIRAVSPAPAAAERVVEPVAVSSPVPPAPAERRPESGREQRPPVNLAVAELTGKNVSQADASIVADFLRTELVNTERFVVVDRANMDKLLAEAGFQQLSGCTEAECAVQMGKLLNVQQMVVGSVSKLMDTYYITVNLVEVETGKIIASHNQEAMTARELLSACRTLAQRIAAR